MQDDALSSSAPEVRLPDAWPPRVIGFDGDDTLWHSESLFSMTQGRFRMLLMHHVDLPSTLIDARLAEFPFAWRTRLDETVIVVRPAGRLVLPWCERARY